MGMSSRVLVLVVFALWSAVCWYWYVCGIKQRCAEQPAAAQQAVPFEPATVLDQEIGAGDTETTTAFTPSEEPAPATARPSTTEPDLTKAYVEELTDHVLIHFPYNSTRKEDNVAIDDYLSRLATQLRGSGSAVTLTGHTDNVGDSKTNVAFAMRRAKNIRDILIAKGVSKKQIVCKSEGEKKPLDSNDNPRGRYRNRRVEVRIDQ